MVTLAPRRARQPWTHRACWGLVVMLSALSSMAQQDSSDRDTARKLGKQAQVALKRGEFAAARDLFEQAERRFHAPTLLLGLARAEVGLGRLAAAREVYLRIPRTTTADAPPAFQKAIEAAQQELIALDPRIPRLSLAVEGASDAQITLDGGPFAGQLGAAFPVDPGEHEVRAVHQGRSESARFRAVEGATSSVVLRFPLPGAAPSAAPPVSSLAPAAPSASGASVASVPPALDGPTRWPRAVGYAALGVGAAGLVTSGISALIALRQREVLLDRCGGSVCPESERARHEDFRSSLRLANTAAVVGGVGVLLGGALLLVTPASPRQASFCLPGLGVGLCGAF